MKSIVILLASLALVYSTSIPKVKPRHELSSDWYQTAIFYQIYPRSFMDSDGDGVGDIQGIISKLEYLKESGITATWLSPIFKSPMKDFGYDISDFRNVDETFGTNDDLKELFEKANELGIKIILDFVPNHSSDQHQWFIDSVNSVDPYTNYYVWHDCQYNSTTNETTPPNNWNSVFYGSAWTYNEIRGQCYLHQFLKEQPDLDFRNPDVIKEMKDVLTYWLDQGAAGFRVDAINHLVENIDFFDEPINDDRDPNAYGYTHKIYTKDQNETYERVYEWRELMDEYTANLEATNATNTYTRIMMTEAYASLEDTMRYYGDGDKLGAHMPFNFILINNLWSGSELLSDGSSASDFKREIDQLLEALPEGQTTNWVMGNHDQSRVGSRYGTEKIDALLALVMTLPGIAVTYNGEEIGMVDLREISYEDTQDPQGCNLGPENYKAASRDPVRTPFQWSSEQNAGFSTAEKTWLPVHPNYVYKNLEVQKNAERSTYKFYLQLSELRKKHTMMEGTYESKVIDDDILTFIRKMDDHDSYITIINFGPFERILNLKETWTDAGDIVKVVAAGAQSCKSEDDELESNRIYLRPFDAIVVMNSSGKLLVSFTLIIFSFIWSRLFN